MAFQFNNGYGKQPTEVNSVVAVIEIGTETVVFQQYRTLSKPRFQALY